MAEFSYDGIALQWERMYQHAFGAIATAYPTPKVTFEDDELNLAKVMRVQGRDPQSTEYTASCRVATDVLQSSKNSKMVVEYMLEQLLWSSSIIAFKVWYSPLVLQQLGRHSYDTYCEHYCGLITNVEFSGVPVHPVDEKTLIRVQMKEATVTKPMREFRDNPDYLYGYLMMLHKD